MIKTLYPIFQKWSEKGSIYIISDTHFDDIDRLYMGYYISETEQLEYLTKICTKNDTLIHLGDVGNELKMNKIKSYKVLIKGNHDTGKTTSVFNEVFSGPVWIADKLVLSHEPLDLRCGFDVPIAFNIHGHDHGDKIYKDNFHLNLTQNIYGYNPLRLADFINQGFLKNIKSIHRMTIEKRF